MNIRELPEGAPRQRGKQCQFVGCGIPSVVRLLGMISCVFSTALVAQMPLFGPSLAAPIRPNHGSSARPSPVTLLAAPLTLTKPGGSPNTISDLSLDLADPSTVAEGLTKNQKSAQANGGPGEAPTGTRAGRRGPKANSATNLQPLAARGSGIAEGSRPISSSPILGTSNLLLVELLDARSGIRIRMNALTNKAYRIQATTDFQTWTDLGLMSSAGAWLEFSDPSATNFTRRFYRSVED